MSHTILHASSDAHSVIHLRLQTPGGHSLYSVQVLLHDEWGNSGLVLLPKTDRGDTKMQLAGERPIKQK